MFEGKGKDSAQGQSLTGSMKGQGLLLQSIGLQGLQSSCFRVLGDGRTSCEFLQMATSGPTRILTSCSGKGPGRGLLKMSIYPETLKYTILRRHQRLKTLAFSQKN